MTDRGELAAVLFDMDGTLLDSERLWDAALSALAEQLGGALSDRARLAMIGRNASESMAIFYADLGVSEPDLVADELFLAERMTQLYATDAAWQPGAQQLVTRVRAAGVATALVTSTPRGLVEVALASTLGKHNFDAVVCGDEVAVPKPDPEPYRTAAKLLGVSIAHCVAVEDSPTGMTSALAAGAVALGVPGEVPLTGFNGVPVVGSLTEVDLPFLAGLVNGARRGR